MSLFPGNMPLGAAKRLSSVSATKADPADEARLREACAAGPEEALALLETRLEGLSPDEADERIHRFGPNVLSGEKRKGIVPELFARFKDPMTHLPASPIPPPTVLATPPTSMQLVPKNPQSRGALAAAAAAAASMAACWRCFLRAAAATALELRTPSQSTGVPVYCAQVIRSA